MPGETPNAHRLSNRRRRSNWQDDRSTDKIYASDQVSALGDGTIADSTLKPGEKPKGNHTPVLSSDDRSTDKYYATGGKRLSPQQLARQLTRPNQSKVQSEGVSPHSAQPSATAQKAIAGGKLVVANAHEINGIAQAAIAAVRAGKVPTVVYVEKGNAALLRRVRTAFDSLVAREVLSEEEMRDIRFSYVLGDAEQAELDAKLGAPAPAGEKKAEEVTPVDPHAFLNSQDDEDLGVDPDMSKIQVVDTSSDPAPQAVEQAVEEEDELLVPSKAEEPPAAEVEFMKKIGYEPSAGPQLVDSKDELDRAVDTDKPVRVEEPAGVAINEYAPEPADNADEVETFGSSIETPTESMDGIGDAPKPKKPGRKSGRGSNG